MHAITGQRTLHPGTVCTSPSPCLARGGQCLTPIYCSSWDRCPDGYNQNVRLASVRLADTIEPSVRVRPPMYVPDMDDQTGVVLNALENAA